MIHISRQNALALLRQAVELKGEDYIDPSAYSTANSCQYVTPDGFPSCIVGHALMIAGIGPHAFTDMNQEDISQVAQELEFRGLADFDEDAVRTLFVAQDVQDSGDIWGEALRQAQEAFNS